jgi:HAD superfamily hydrolase (TIGR01544 family)
MEKIIFKNKKDFQVKVDKIKKDGLENLFVLSDFDRTLTAPFYRGKSVPGILAILRNNNYFGDDYSDKAFRLYEKYHPLKSKNNIALSKKKTLMEKWYNEHYKILMENGFDKKAIYWAANRAELRLRKGVAKALNFLRNRDIPLIIISASGVGEEGIKACLKKFACDYGNIFVISNRFVFDRYGRVIKIKKPIIHSANKDAIKISDFPLIGKAIKNKRNVILLGDSLDDPDMDKGFCFENIIKICFLREENKKNIADFKKRFDAVIMPQSSFVFVNKLFNNWQQGKVGKGA